MPTLAALALTLVVTLGGVFSPRFGNHLGLYPDWLLGIEQHQSVSGGLCEHRRMARQPRNFCDRHPGHWFDVMWLVRLLQGLAARLQSMIAFALLAFAFMILGLLEVGHFEGRIRKLEKQYPSWRWTEGIDKISGQFRKYMIVRSVASILTGLAHVLFCAACRPRAAGGMGHHLVCAQLHTISSCTSTCGCCPCDGVRRGPVRIVADDIDRLRRAQLHPVLDRELSSSPCLPELLWRSRHSWSCLRCSSGAFSGALPVHSSVFP